CLGIQAEEEDLIAAEEKEALAIQKRLAEEIDEKELELEWFLPQKKEEGKEKKAVEEKITRDLSKLSKREKLELLKQESPELLDLVEDFQLQMRELNDKIQPIIQLIKTGVILPGPASDFLTTKQDLILNYCTNISFYMVLKAQRVPVKSHPVMKRLLAYRNLLKQLEPVDKKLSPEINEILEKLKKGEHIEPKLSSREPPKRKLRILQQKEDSIEPKDAGKEEQDKRKKVRLVETADEKEVLALYEMMKGGKKTTQRLDEEISSEGEAMDEDHDEDEGEEGGKRGISYEIAKNKGLTPHRKKEQRNPRVRLKMKYKKAKTRRKGQVREPRKELSRYGGEISGIRAGVVHSIKLK
ncbi:something about silencing protein 10-like, partial [Limulus polyphemus]|uniref:Something about silencing protein 10-like n=1 Tax=Limulus polyphemus TaxID=6850 RepID=A0ABM1TQW5_LIMPO